MMIMELFLSCLSLLPTLEEKIVMFWILLFLFQKKLKKKCSQHVVFDARPYI